MADQVRDQIEFAQLDLANDAGDLASRPGFVVDVRGSVMAVINPAEPAAFITVMDFFAGEPQGNHFHQQKVEYLAVLSGRLHCAFWLPDTPSAVEERTLERGEVVRIAPGCAHLYTALDGDATALEYSPQAFDRADMHPSEPRRSGAAT